MKFSLVETICLNAERYVTLTAYIPDKGSIGLYEKGRPGVLILPAWRTGSARTRRGNPRRPRIFVRAAVRSCCAIR